MGTSFWGGGRSDIIGLYNEWNISRRLHGPRKPPAMPCTMGTTAESANARHAIEGHVPRASKQIAQGISTERAHCGQARPCGASAWAWRPASGLGGHPHRRTRPPTARCCVDAEGASQSAALGTSRAAYGGARRLALSPERGSGAAGVVRNLGRKWALMARSSAETGLSLSAHVLAKRPMHKAPSRSDPPRSDRLGTPLLGFFAKLRAGSTNVRRIPSHEGPFPAEVPNNLSPDLATCREQSW